MRCLMQRHEHEQWLEEAIMLIPSQYERDDWREYFTPVLRRCHSNSRHTFWSFLRIQLAKSPDTAWLLEYMQESHVPPEVVPTNPDDFQYEVNGDVALIPVGDETAHGV